MHDEKHEYEHGYDCECEECKKKRMEYMTRENCNHPIVDSLNEIEENTHKSKKILKDICEDVKCIEESQEDLSKEILVGLKKLNNNEEEDCNMMMGNGIVPTMPLAAGGDNNGMGDGFGGWGVLMGLLFGALFMGDGFFGNRDKNGTSTDSLTSAIDTNAILAGIQSTNADVLKASTDNQLATAAQTNAIQSNMNNGFTNMQSGITSLGNGICDAAYATGMAIQDGKYSNTIATMNAASSLGNQICGEGRQVDNQFAGVAKDICQLGRSGDQNTFAISRQLDNMAANQAACCCEVQKGIMESTYQTSRQLDAMARQNAECCCEQKLMNTMGFANIQNSIKDGFCDLKADMAREKIEQLRIEQAITRDALNDKSLADAINTTLTNGFTQLGAVFTSNIIPAIQSAVARV